MVKFSKTAEVVKAVTYEPGEYLFKIYEVQEKTSKAGNDYWLVKFETKDGVKMSDIFLFAGKGATKTLGLFTACGLADGENFPTKEFDTDDILGSYLYVNAIADLDENKKPTGYLKCPWDINDYKPYDKKQKKVVVEEPIEELPF